MLDERRPQDEQAPRQHPRPVRADRPARRRRACAGSCSRGGSPWVGPPRRRTRRSSEIVRKVLLTYWNTASFLVTLRERRRLVAGRPPRPAPRDRPLLDRWALGELRALRRRGHRGARRLRLRARRPRDRRVRRRPVELVRPPLAAPVLGRRRRRRSRRCTSALETRQPADGAVHAVRHRLPVDAAAGRGRRRTARGLAGLGAPARLARGDGGSRRRGRRCARRWRWSAAWWSWAARRGPRPGSGPASRSSRAVVPRPASRSWPPRRRASRPGARAARRDRRGAQRRRRSRPPDRTSSRSRSSRTTARWASGSASARQPSPTP